MNHEELEAKLDGMVGAILLQNALYVRQSSGLVLADVVSFRFKVCEYLPLVGREFKQLPTFLAQKKAIVNVQNTDNRCFGYAIASALAKLKKNKERPQNYNQLFQTFKLNQIQYHVEVADIPAIEIKLGVGINVYSFFDDEGKGRYPLYATKKVFERTVDLLYWDEHFAWIKNFRRFVADLSCHYTLHLCRSCLGHFSTEEVLNTHKRYCRGVDTSGQVLLLP